MAEAQEISSRPELHHARSGVPGYDAVGFSQPPQFVAFNPPGALISLVRHSGIIGGGIALAVQPGSTVEGDVLNVLRRAHGGRMESRIDDRGYTFELLGEQALFVPCGADNKLEFPASTCSLRICFPKGRLQQLAPSARDLHAPAHISENRRLAALADVLDTELDSPGFASRLLIDGVARAIAVLVARLGGGEGAAADDRIHLAPTRLRRVKEFIHANLGADIGLDDLATVAQLSPFHFSRMFKLATGQTPHAYVRARRLERARDLLEQTDMPLVHVALACGFANQSHFTAAFTRAMGMPPGRHRRLFGRFAAGWACSAPAGLPH